MSARAVLVWRTVIALWMMVPPPARSYIVSSAHTVWSAVVILVTIGYTDPHIQCCTTFVSTLQFVAGEWWVIVLGVVFGVGPIARAMAARSKAGEASGQNGADVSP